MFREELSKSLAFSEVMLREMTGSAKPGSDTGSDTGQSRPRGRYGGFQALIAISRVGARARRRRVAAAPADSDGDGPGGYRAGPGTHRRLRVWRLGRLWSRSTLVPWIETAA